MMPRPWTMRELTYLHAHAAEGAKPIAEHLNRSARAVKEMARKNGISLRPRWYCPNCNRIVYSPLSPATGWCRRCSIEDSLGNAAKKNDEVRRELEAEQQRVLEMKRLRQKCYSDTDRCKNELRKLKAMK